MTANALQLEWTGLFSASEPGSSQLLDINPSAFLFNALSHQAIVNTSTATTTLFGSPTFGLQVPKVLMVRSSSLLRPIVHLVIRR